MSRKVCIGCMCAAVLATAWLGACGRGPTPTAPTPGATSGTGQNPLVRVAGRVYESGGFGLPQVQVTIVGGSMDGFVTLTDQYGNYEVSNAPGVRQVRAAKDGYFTVTVSVGSNPAQVNIVMSSTTPYADLRGSWHLTFSASSTCQLPDEAMTRRYTASIEQDNAGLTVRLSDAQFGSDRSNLENWIFGRVSGNHVTLTMGGDNDACFYYGECLVEELADGRVLTLNGSAVGSVNRGVLAATLAGAVGLSATPPGTQSVCTAADHHLTFTR
jgi:hypothetical protein